MNIEELKIGDEVFVKGVISDVSFGIHGNKKFDVRTTPFEDIKGFVTKDRLMLPNQPEVPRFVAEWIEKCKEEGLTLSLSYDVDAFGEMAKWLYDTDDNTNIDLFAKAWLAYPNITVEQEKLYTVEIPNPNGTKVYLWKCFITGKIGIKLVDNDFESDEMLLTESEIRKDFDWAWQFREEVVE